jgi:hypothetical protein
MNKQTYTAMQLTFIASEKLHYINIQHKSVSIYILVGAVLEVCFDFSALFEFGAPVNTITTGFLHCNILNHIAIARNSQNLKRVKIY